MKKKKYGIPTIPLSRLFPSIITMLALCLGITAVRYSFDDKFEIAAVLIIIAAIMDGLDGRLARFLNATSAFGAQLDSLADLVSFGVAPAIVTYLWSLHQIPYRGIGWSVILIFILCAAFRLARYNTSAESKSFFIGVPMPAAAFLCIAPMMISFQILDLQQNYWLIAFYTTLIGILMASKIPTFAFKNIKIKRNKVIGVMLAAMCIITFLLIMPWIAFPLLALLYICSIPLSIISLNQLKNK